MKEVFVASPNLPKGKVTLAAVGDYPEIKEALNKEGIKTISFENKALSEEVCRHSDMLICHTGKNFLYCEPETDTEFLESLGFETEITDKLGGSYPDDVKLNVAISNSFFICNPKTADEYLTGELIIKGKIPYYVKQGYTKCSVCLVTENALITEDPSIYETLKDTSLDVLLISQGDIYLSAKHSGFFGGSSGKIAKNVLAVTGELKYHKDGERIRGFCEKYEVEIKELKKGKIIDVGGILPLKEKS